MADAIVDVGRRMLDRREAIQEGFRAIRPELRRCYEAILDTEPRAGDSLVFELTVRLHPDDGAVGVGTLDAITSESFSPEQLDCFADAVATVPFPAPDPPSPGLDPSSAEYRLRYPVVLSAE